MYFIVGFTIKILFVVVAVFLAGSVKSRYVFLVNIITALLSFVLASYFIADEGGGVKPVGRDVAVILGSVVFLDRTVISKVVFTCVFHEK